jgi:hypothetical protein
MKQAQRLKQEPFLVKNKFENFSQKDFLLNK